MVSLFRYVCDIAKQPDSLGSMELFLDLLNAIVCYSSLPVDALVPFVTTLCHTLNVERFCEKSWQVAPLLISVCCIVTVVLQCLCIVG